MKIAVFVALLLLGFSTTVTCDDQDEIKTLTTPVQELAGSDTGLSDSERFEEIVGMTYKYSMLSYPEFATYLGEPRGQYRGALPLRVLGANIRTRVRSKQAE